jgi:hypothetical protein
MTRFDSFAIPESDTPIMGEERLEQPAGTDELAEDNQPSEVAQLAQQFTQGMKEVQQSNNLAQQLLADPNIQQYVAGLRNGKQFKLVEDSAQQTIKEPEGDPEEMDNKGLVDFTLAKMSARLEQTMGKFFEPIQQQMQQLQGLASAMQASGTQREIQEAQQKYQDFDKFRPKMKELSEATGGRYKIEELYRMAKAMAGEQIGQVVNPSSERPTIIGSRQHSMQQQRRQQSDPNAHLGKAGFSALISQAQALNG